MKVKPVQRVARVDLSKNKVETVELDEKMARKYLGGSGLGAKVLWDETDKDTDPLSEESPIIFGIGPLTAPGVPQSSRMTVVALSPETDIYGEARTGGDLPALLKRAGFMAVVVKGKAKKPVYLHAKDGELKIKDASHLWGKPIMETDDILRKEEGGKTSVLTIGPAGEKQVRIACIIVDGRRGHAAGRTGMGAVMGSKNLKALVATLGTIPQEIYDRECLKESVERNYPKTRVMNAEEIAGQKSGMEGIFWDRGVIKNFQVGDVPVFADRYADKLGTEYAKVGKPDPCMYCRIACCMNRLEPNGERINHPESQIPFGSNCLIDDFKVLQEINTMCNEYGIDTISGGDIIAFAMECYEKGLITKKDTDGLDLTWGNAQAALELVRKIGEREGFGEVLGAGMNRAIESIGGRAAECAVICKGLPPSLHDPRSSNAHSLNHATGNRGGCHSDGYPWLFTYDFDEATAEAERKAEWASFLSDKGKDAVFNRFATEGMGELVALAQDLSMTVNSLTLCWFSPYPSAWRSVPLSGIYAGTQPSTWAEWLHCVTGWDNLTGKEMRKIGERIFNLQRLINLRKGITAKDDCLPPRLLTPRGGGRSKASDNVPPIEPMMKEYYRARGWNAEGIPTKEKLEELDLVKP